ncbi:hypothetical protein EYF80_049170 [Liparis tanakae]|uniref:Uncharacterized protein n=1 Tax=Liparis tanakae TaxID=230148 RepID=A0A4Z2FI84_9TELE|nr:hypothetical protein EYF80_049170 [Liparis tanakae]
MYEPGGLHGAHSRCDGELHRPSMKVSGSTTSPIVSGHLGHLFGTGDAGRPQPVTRDTQGKGNWHIGGVDEVKNQRLWETCAERQTTKMGA